MSLPQSVINGLKSQLVNTNAYKSFQEIGNKIKGYGSTAASYAGSYAQATTDWSLGSGRTSLGDMVWDALGGSNVGSSITAAFNDFVEEYFDKVFGTSYQSQQNENIFDTLGIPQSQGSYTDGFEYSSGVGFSSASVSVSYGGYSGTAKINMNGSFDLSAGGTVQYNGGSANVYGEWNTMNGNYNTGFYVNGDGNWNGVGNYTYGAGANWNNNYGFRAAVAFKLYL